MIDNPNRQIQERFVAALLAGDTDTVRSLCAPEFVLHEGSGVPFAGTFHGAEGFFEFFALFNETLDVEELAPVRIYAADDPDWLVGELILRSTLRASGKRFDSSILELWQFANGQVIGIKPHYFNAA